MVGAAATYICNSGSRREWNGTPVAPALLHCERAQVGTGRLAQSILPQARGFFKGPADGGDVGYCYTIPGHPYSLLQGLPGAREGLVQDTKTHLYLFFCSVFEFGWFSRSL